MEQFNLRNDEGRNVKFTGECIGSACNEFDRACGSAWSGETGRRYELALYRSNSGRLICERIMYTQWVGERDHHVVKLCLTLENVFDFFGYGPLAKQLYKDAAIDDAEQVA